MKHLSKTWKSKESQEEKDLNQEEYLRGFNEGYITSKYEPSAFKEYNICWEDSEHDPYIAGMLNGKMQHEKELVKEQIKKSKEERNQLNKGHNFER